MMSEQRLVPELRFPDFSESWDSVKLGEITNITAGGTPRTTIAEFWGGNIPWMNSGELNLKKVKDVENRITQKGLNNSSTKLIPEKCILIGLAGQGKTRATAAINLISLCTNQSIAAVFPNEEYFDPLFLFQNIDSRYNEIRNMSTGQSGRGSLNLKIIKSIKVKLPSIQEQQKIASFLSAVDQRIALLEKKKELLEQYKKGVMQKIFSQEVRFKDEHGNEFPDWEYLKANDLFRNHSNKDHNGELPILSASQEHGMIFREDSGIRIQSSESSVKSYKIVEKNDFVISLRSFQGGIDFSSITGICSPAYIVLKNKKPIDYHFYKHFFKKESFIHRLSNTVVGIRDGKQITYDNFSSLKIPYPSMIEQMNISSFIDSIEELRERLEHKLDLSKKFKKGLLQKMFV